MDAQFEAADLNHDGVIDEDEFTLYYFQEICFKFPVGKNGFNPGAALYNIFANYCSFGKGGRRCEEMESHQLLRLAKECQLIDRHRCRQADIDLVFHRSRAKSMSVKVRPALNSYARGSCAGGRNSRKVGGMMQCTPHGIPPLRVQRSAHALSCKLHSLANLLSGPRSRVWLYGWSQPKPGAAQVW